MTNKTSSRFTDLSPLGEGGMASVFRAYDSKTNEFVALKRLHSSLAHDEVEKKRLLREARVCQKLRHPKIVRVLDVVEESGELALVMELIVGDNLRSLINQKLPLEVAIGFLLQIAEGLDYAHEENVIHRDLKPSNIFVTKDKLIKIGDWGLTRTQEDTSGLTKTGVLLGTPRYMAPEQIKGLELTPAVDMYAFGVMLFEVLTQRAPFQSKDLARLLREHLESNAPRLRRLLPGVSNTLDKLVASLLEKDPELRPCARKTIEILQRSLNEGPQVHSSAKTTSFGHSAASFGAKLQSSPSLFKRNSRLALILFLLLLLPLGYFLLSFHSDWKTTKEKDTRKETFNKKAENKYREGLRAYTEGKELELPNDVKNAAKAIDPLIVMDTIWDHARQTKEQYDKLDFIDEHNGSRLFRDTRKLYELALLVNTLLKSEKPNELIDKMALTLMEAIQTAYLSVSRAVIRSEHYDLNKLAYSMIKANLKHQAYKKVIYPPLAEKLQEMAKESALHPTMDLLLILLNRRLEKDRSTTTLCQNLRKRMNSEPWRGSFLSPFMIAAAYQKEAEVIRKYLGSNSTEFSPSEMRERALNHATAVIDFIVSDLPELKNENPSEEVDYATLWATAALQNIVRAFLDRGTSRTEKEIGYGLVDKFLTECKSHPVMLSYVFSYLHHYAARDEPMRAKLREALASFWQQSGWGHLPRVEVQEISEDSVLRGWVKDRDTQNRRLNYSVRVSYHKAQQEKTDKDGSFQFKLPAKSGNEKQRDVQISVQDYPNEKLFVELYCISLKY